MRRGKRLVRMLLWGMLPLLVLALASPGAAAPTWMQLNPTPDPNGSPTPRGFHSAVYNPTTNRMVVFGGCPEDASSHTIMINDVWVLTNADGQGTPAWIKLNPLTPNGGPSPRLGHSAVFDQANNRMIVYGGQEGQSIRNDAWVLINADGTGGDPAWTPLATSGPAPSSCYHGAAYDAANNLLIIQGGFQNGAWTNDAWKLTNANGLGGTQVWSKLAPTTAETLPTWNPAGYDPVSNTLISCILTYYTSVNQVWLLKNANGLGGAPYWTELTPSGVPPTRHFFTAVYDGSRNKMVMFGGGWSARLNDAWRLENANGLGGAPQWTQLSPAGILPAPRDVHSAVYNPGSDRMIIFGGEDPPQSFGDVWVLTEAMGPAPLINVTIDIKPGSDVNSINPDSKGKIAVAIVSTPDFNAPEMVDWGSLRFG